MEDQADEDEKIKSFIRKKIITAKTKTEKYNIYDLYLLQIFNSENGEASHLNQGIISDFRSSDYLRDKQGCSDIRIGKYNVLRLYHPQLNFERIFVFYDMNHNFGVRQSHRSQVSALSLMGMDQHKQLVVGQGIKEGEKNLKKMLTAWNILFDKIYSKSSDLKGRIAEVGPARVNEYDDRSLDSNDA